VDDTGDDVTITPPTDVPGIESEEILYYSYGWEIHGTMYPAKSKSPEKAIILVPMLGHDRTSYPSGFIERLHNGLEDTVIVTIDPRGHGQSTSLGTWNDFTKIEFMGMENDVLDAKKTIEDSYPNVDEYYVVGASIGSTSAINAAGRDRDFIKVVMISPGWEYRGVEIEDGVDDYNFPLLLISASGDSYSANSVTLIESASTSKVTKKTYSGSAHGTDLFDATESESESLEDAIYFFLRK
jgi:pimeloyl-ACP methyl ester carboxylesterase